MTTVHAKYSEDIWCTYGAPSVLWLSHDPWLSNDNFGKAPARVHFGPIIDSENGHFQSSSKLCRFAGTKVNSKIPHN